MTVRSVYQVTPPTVGGPKLEGFRTAHVPDVQPGIPAPATRLQDPRFVSNEQLAALDDQNYAWSIRPELAEQQLGALFARYNDRNQFQGWTATCRREDGRLARCDGPMHLLTPEGRSAYETLLRESQPQSASAAAAEELLAAQQAQEAQMAQTTGAMTYQRGLAAGWQQWDWLKIVLALTTLWWLFGRRFVRGQVAGRRGAVGGRRVGYRSWSQSAGFEGTASGKGRRKKKGGGRKKTAKRSGARRKSARSRARR